MDKNSLRTSYLEKRRSLSRGFVAQESALIGNKLFSIQEVTGAKKVSVYIAFDNEVETRGIINELVSRDVEIFLPCFFEETYVFSKFISWEGLEEGPFGILQPKHTPGVSLGESVHTPGVDLDVSIIPGVAFSKSGVRLGYGKGVFDQLLAGSNATKIGLAYSFQVVDELPREDHDLVMDYIVCEKEVVSISR